MVGLYVAVAVVVIVLSLINHYQSLSNIYIWVICAPALFGGVVAGAILGKLADCMKCCRGCSCCRKESEEQHGDPERFLSIFGWALEGYKTEIEGFELWNLICRTVIIGGSTVMYSENRFTTHIIVMVWSFILHLRYRPYKDNNSNIAAILFCICDILGAVTAYQAYKEQASVALQMIFIIITLITLIVIGIFLVDAIGSQAVSLRDGLAENNTHSIFSGYTKLEKILLFPILGIVWILVKVYRCFLPVFQKLARFTKSCTKRCCTKKKTKQTKVVPTEKDAEEKTQEQVETEKKQRQIAATLEMTRKQFGAGSPEYKTLLSLYTNSSAEGNDESNNENNKDNDVNDENNENKTMAVNQVDLPAKQKLIVRSSTTGKTWEYDLKESRQIYIGSDEDDSDILLDEDSEVSSDHAVLQWDLATSRLIFTDTDSTNGSKVNDNVAEANIQIDLNSDDNIQIGNTTLTIQLL